MPLTQELRRMGIPVTPFTPGKGGLINLLECIHVRLYLKAVAWCPDRNFAEEVIEECASFPNGEHDDGRLDDTGYTTF